MELLVNQLGDKNRAISLTAMSILEEAIHNKVINGVYIYESQ
jgi:hypothetical protein